jgi:hypothetical protein
MGKVGKSRKRARREKEIGFNNHGTNITTTTLTSQINTQQQQQPNDSSSIMAVASTINNSDEQLDEIDIDITVTTMKLLLNHPTTLLKSSQVRMIRTYAYAIVDVLGGGTGNGKSIIGRISDALHDHRWIDALSLLQQMNQHTIQQNHPHNDTIQQQQQSSSLPPLRLGTLQRWIRDLFETTISNTNPTITYAILYHILHCIGQTPFNDDESDTNNHTDHNNMIIESTITTTCRPLVVYPMWFSTPRTIPVQAESTTIQEESNDWTIPTVQALVMESAWREGMTLWSCNVNVLQEQQQQQDTTQQQNEIVRCNVPFVPGAFVLNHVLSSIECDRIRNVAEKMGYTPEASYSLSDTTSKAADGVVWVVHDTLLNDLFHRVKSLLPLELCGGSLIHLNSRWRIYRYTTGTVYRPHIDGAWTGSGIVNGSYVNDIYDGNVISRLTFLIYLNDDFENGGTTFYLPSNTMECVVARSVAPIQGSVLCFPHGPGVDHIGLVHEGSAVTKGTKYVLRSDVLYTKT